MKKAMKPAPSPAETKMKSAIERLYFAANWHPDRVVDAAALWSAVRDAAGIAPGQTASRLGPDRGCVTAPSPAKREHQFIEHHREAASEMHPWYGPCDGFGVDGACSECTGVVARTPNPQEAEIAALRAALAERGKDLVDAADSLFKAVARANAAEAALKKAEEDNERLERARSHHLVRADVAENTLEDVWKALGYADGEPPGYPYSLAEIVHERDFAAMRMIEQRDAAEACLKKAEEKNKQLRHLLQLATGRTP